MKVVGIVGEYNPFHCGHQYHIEETRLMLGEDTAVICVMSGDFVQRGSAAVFDKHARAEAAARCGADIVFELPLPWSISSAEGFARGAVGLLGALGVVTHLSFGSECGSIQQLDALAAALLDPETGAKITAEMAQGITFASARQRVLERELGGMAKLLETPNNILGVEYLKALYTLRLGIEPVTVTRTGAEHDGTTAAGNVSRKKHGEKQIRSASELRMLLCGGESIAQSVPDAAWEIYKRQMEHGRGPISDDVLESAVLSRLRMLPDPDFDMLPDATEGLGNRLRECARNEPTLEAVIAAAKSKRYALSRIRRMAMCAALGVRKGMADGIPQYARLLACTERGRGLLRTVSERSDLPIITKPASVRELSPESLEIFRLGARARDLYVLGYSVRGERKGGSDWRMNPAVL